MTAFLFSAVMSAPASAAPDLLTDPFQLSFGSFVLNLDPSVRLDGQSQTGTEVDWKQAFGLDETSRFRLDGSWRFAQRHKMRASWFNDSRRASAIVDADIVWGDEVFPIGADVSSQFDFNLYQLAYDYAISQGARHEINVSGGLHVTDLKVSLAASLTPSDASSASVLAESGRVTAPLPVFGVNGLLALPNHFWLDARAEYFYLTVGPYQGSIFNARMGVKWQPRTWLGLGLSYDYSSLSIDVDRQQFTGRLKWKYNGPIVFYSTSF
jgi:hypothetical protein